MALSNTQLLEIESVIEENVIRQITDDYANEPDEFDADNQVTPDWQDALNGTLNGEGLAAGQVLVGQLLTELAVTLPKIKAILPLETDGDIVELLTRLDDKVDPLCRHTYKMEGGEKKEVMVPFWQELYEAFAKNHGWTLANEPSKKPKKKPGTGGSGKKDEISTEPDPKHSATKPGKPTVGSPEPKPDRKPEPDTRAKVIEDIKTRLPAGLAQDFQEYMDWFFSMGPDARAKTLVRLRQRTGSYEKMDSNLVRALVQAMHLNLHYWPN